MSARSEFLNIIYVDEVCRMFLFVLHLTVSPLHELPKPRSTPNTLTPLLHTSLQRVCFGNLHVLTNNSPNEINHSCTQREILCTQCDDKMKHVWGKPCVPACPELCYLLKEHVPNVFGFCYPLWLQLSLSFGIYDFRSDCLDSFNGTLLECGAWGDSPGRSGPCKGLVLEGFWGINPLFHLEPQTNDLSKYHALVVIWKLFSSSITLFGTKYFLVRERDNVILEKNLSMMLSLEASKVLDWHCLSIW